MPFFARFVAGALAAVFAVGGIGAAFLAWANELCPFAAEHVETNAEILWGPLFAQQWDVYKLRRTLYLKPELLVLGSSRTNQFRAGFAPGVRTYNASLGTSSASGAAAFARALYPRHKPRVIVLAVDPWWFDPARIAPCDDCAVPSRFDYRAFLATALSTGLSPRAVNLMWRSTLERRADPLGGRLPVGLLAAVYGDGARPDGSQQYGSIVRGLRAGWDEEGYGPEHGFRYYVQDVRERRGRFAYTGELDARAVADLRTFVALTHQAGVGLLIALLPHAPPVQAAIDADEAQRGYHERVRAAVAGLCGPCEFHDLSDFASLGVSERHMLDGIHLDEFGWFAAWRRMVEHSALLAEIVKPESIAALAGRVDGSRMFR